MNVLIYRTCPIGLVMTLALVSACSSGNESGSGSSGSSGSTSSGASSGSSSGASSGGAKPANLGEDCTCAGVSGAYACASSNGPCAQGLTCVGDSTFGGKCYGEKCCEGSSCDPFTPKPGTGDTGCPAGQRCTVWKDRLYGFCKP